MSSRYFSEPCIAFTHYTLKTQSLFHWATGKGKGWGEGTWYRTQPAHMSSWASMRCLGSRHSLQNHLPDEKVPRGHCSGRTWWKLHSPVGKTFLPNATNPAQQLMWEVLKSVARQAQSEQAIDWALNRARGQHSPHWNFTRGKSIIFIRVFYSVILTQETDQMYFPAWKLQ